MVFGIDLDDLLAYKTVRYASIRNRYLGLMHYAFEFFIFCYVFLYNIVYQKGYMKMVTPVSSIRMQAQAPIARDNPDLTNLSYCQPSFLAKLDGNASCVFYDGESRVQERGGGERGGVERE